MKIIGESFAGVATLGTRLVEMYCPEEKRLFQDRFALKLLPFGWRVFFRLAYLPGLRSLVLSLRERRMPGTLGAIICRTRYIDDVLRKSLQECLDQLVVLGAGFDTRAYRIAGMDQVRVFEVDLPGARNLKQIRVEKVLGEVPDNVTFVGMNFEQDKLDDVLKAAGFQKGKRTLFIWEGVTQYLTADAVNDTLEFVSSVSGVGSAIVFTYVRRGIVDGTASPEWFKAFLSFAARVGSPLKFGLNPVELGQYLADRGLKLISDVGAADYQDLYLEPLGRELNVFDAERVALAQVNGSRRDCMQSDADVRSQIRQVLERFNHLVSTKNMQVLAEFAPSDALLLIGSEAGEIAEGREELGAFFARTFAREVTFSWEWDRIDASRAGEVAWFFAEGWVILSTAAEQRRSPYRISGVLERHGERWLWRQYHGSEPVISG